MATIQAPSTTLIETNNSPRADDDIERGLTALAYAGDNSHKASKIAGVPSRTLRDWRQRFPERYQEIRTLRAPEINAACVQQFRDLQLEAIAAASLSTKLEYERVRDGDVKDAAGSARNLATVAAIAADKIALAEGRPTSIVEHRSAEEVMRGLAAKGYVDTTAEEIT